MNKLYPSFITHAHGVTRTFVDIAIANNKSKKYTCSDEVIEDIYTYFTRLAKQGDNVAEISLRTLIDILKGPEVFVNGSLNECALRTRIETIEFFGDDVEKAYYEHCKEKLCNIVLYLNDYRSYTSADQIFKDFTDSCSLYVKLEILMSPLRAGTGYPFYYLQIFLNENWTDICTDGVLDNEKLQNKLLTQHEERLKKHSLPEIISQFYMEADNPCHSEEYHPNEKGTAPVYVKGERRFYPSCGHGIGPNAIQNYLEFSIVHELLKKDERYMHVGPYFFPVSDMKLPVYSDKYGRLEFDTVEEKEKFVSERKRWWSR